MVAATCAHNLAADTAVGKLGDTLSGGERQRLKLTRAFLHNASFMLLDELTSNLGIKRPIIAHFKHFLPYY